MSQFKAIVLFFFILLGCSYASPDGKNQDPSDSMFMPYSNEITKIKDDYMNREKLFHFNTVTNVPGGVVMQTTSYIAFNTDGPYAAKAISTSNVFIPGVQAQLGPNGKYKLEKIPAKEPKNLEG